MTEVNQDILWDNVYDARTAVFEKKFGLFPDEILKLGHMTGVWPGGGLFKSKASELGEDLWLYTTFGLTNPDMPTQYLPQNINQTDGNIELTLTKKETVPVYPERPGYGYEIIVLTQGEADWPLGLLQWAVNAEMLNDADLLGRVKKYNGLTIEDVMVGDGDYVNVLITQAHSPLPGSFTLPNGEGQLLIATVITDDEMAWSMKNGRDKLLTKLLASNDKQVSVINRPSVLNPASINYPDIDNREQAEELAAQGMLRKTYLFPLEFGGQDDPMNVVYLPKMASLSKKVFDQQVMELAQQGNISNYSASPNYQADSFIPESIDIVADGEAGISTRIEVW
ncbi:suppressor of fused domain protein [Shewanella algae]|uniref:suppressor of fused domain protein n=1 Tax=Shewanella algae TaxID=38313 RepID=UPI001AACE46F|nr:suppressor of fused domain protein [Shewanella algae]